MAEAAGMHPSTSGNCRSFSITRWMLQAPDADRQPVFGAADFDVGLSEKRGDLKTALARASTTSVKGNLHPDWIKAWQCRPRQALFVLQHRTMIDMQSCQVPAAW